MTNQVMTDHDEEFRKVERRIKRFSSFFIAAWILVSLTSFALMGCVVYVAWHFISKYW